MARQRTDTPARRRTPQADRPRPPAAEALAARVRAAAEAALAAFHAASADCERIRTAEWDKPRQDTLAEIESAADALHGLASWVLGGSPHPDRAGVRATLTDLGRTTGGLHAKHPEYNRGYKDLWAYVRRLGELQSALTAYFEAEKTTTKRAVPARSLSRRATGVAVKAGHL